MDIRVFLELENQLLSRLRKTWIPLAAQLQAKVDEAIKAGDFAAAYDLARNVDLSDVGLKNRDFIKYLLKAHANFGASLAGNSSALMVNTLNADGLLDKVVRVFCASLEHNATIQTYKTVMQQIRSAEKAAEKAAEQAKNEVKKAADRYVNTFVSFAEAGDANLQLIASLHSSRLSTWGFAAEADLLGITTYKLSAVLDGRTSHFCRVINGKRFSVKDVRESINEVLSVENPDDVKILQPWPAQDAASIERFSSMTSQELTDLNLHFPPYHPKCRTLCVKVASAPKLQRPTPPPAPNVPALELSTEASFQEVGMEVTEAGLRHWNDYIGVAPMEMLQTFLGLSAVDMVSGLFDKYTKKISIKPQGYIGLRTQLVSDEGTVTQALDIDPFSGNANLSLLELKNMDETFALTTLKESVSDAVETAQKAGASTFSMTVGGDFCLYVFAKLGMVPSPSDWFSIKEKMLNTLISQGLRVNLKPEQKKLVIQLLQSRDENSIIALANLPFTVDGKHIMQALFDGKGVDLQLDLFSQIKVDRFKQALSES